MAAGVQRVVIAALDPNPAVAGTGLTALREAGLDVCWGRTGARRRTPANRIPELDRPWSPVGRLQDSDDPGRQSRSGFGR